MKMKYILLFLGVLLIGWLALTDERFQWLARPAWRLMQAVGFRNADPNANLTGTLRHP